MNNILTRALLATALTVSGAQAIAADADMYVVKPGPNWTFIEGKKNAIELPDDGKIIFGARMEKFEAWKSTHKEQLLLFKGYSEPMMVSSSSENKEPKKKELEVFDARFAFVVNQPIDKFTEQSMLNMKFITDMDPNFKQETMAAANIEPSGDPLTDKIAWCTAPSTLCLQSTFELSTFPAKALQVLYLGMGRLSYPDTILLQSEISFVQDAKAYSMYNSEVRVVSQKTFYINHFFQYAVTNIIFNKIDDKRTLVVGMTAIGVQEDVLNMGGDALATLGITSTRDFIYSGTGLGGLRGVENGLVPYAQEMAANLKAALSKF